MIHIIIPLLTLALQAGPNQISVEVAPSDRSQDWVFTRNSNVTAKGDIDVPRDRAAIIAFYLVANAKIDSCDTAYGAGKYEISIGNSNDYGIEIYQDKANNILDTSKTFFKAGPPMGGSYAVVVDRNQSGGSFDYGLRVFCFEKSSSRSMSFASDPKIKNQGGGPTICTPGHCDR
jgi:hypothetical protein